MDNKRIQKHIEFARKYVQEFDHGASGHIDYHTIAHLADELEKAQKEEIHLRAKIDILKTTIAQYRAPIECDAIITGLELSVTTDFDDVSPHGDMWKSFYRHSSHVEITLSAASATISDLSRLRVGGKFFVQLRNAK